MRGATLVAAAAVAIGGLAVSSVQAIPITLFEHNASHEFGTRPNPDPPPPDSIANGAFDASLFHTGSRSWQITYHSAFATSGFNVTDGQASMNDIYNNPFSFWYNAEPRETSQTIQVNLGTFADGGVRALTNAIDIPIVADGQWHQAIVQFSPADDEWVETADRDVNRAIRFRPRGWGLTGTDTNNLMEINYDTVMLIPEPGALGLLGLGGLMLLRRRRQVA